MVWRLFCTTTFSDNGPVGPETCRSFCKLKHNSVCVYFVGANCNKYIKMHGVENVKKVIFSFFLNKESWYGEFALPFLVALHSEYWVRSSLN